VEDALSDGILSGRFSLGSMVRVLVDADDTLMLEQVEEVEAPSL
jgi:hypothetical protein